jgi:hypothetical protein
MRKLCIRLANTKVTEKEAIGSSIYQKVSGPPKKAAKVPSLGRQLMSVFRLSHDLRKTTHQRKLLHNCLMGFENET